MAGRTATIAMGAALLATLALVAVVLAVILLGAPAPDTRHAFSSPSGERDIFLIEACQADACTHQALIELPGTDGPLQVRCGLDIEASAPVFVSVEVEWTADENAVRVRHAGEDGLERSFAIDLTRDCNV